jgi:RNA polymerase sigma-70 factor, ECF subfamily
MQTGLVNDSCNVARPLRSSGSYVEYNEELVLAAARAGSTAAFDRLVERYRARVLRVALSIARSHEDAEEIAQNAFTQAFRYLSRFRGESRFYTWLVRITINEGLMRARRRHLNELSIDDFVEAQQGGIPREFQDSGLTPEERASQSELKRILTRNIAQLPPIYRTVVRLHDVQGYSTHEIAKALAVSSPAVKTRLLRARTALRNSVAKSLRPAESCKGRKRCAAAFRLRLVDPGVSRRCEGKRAA